MHPSVVLPVRFLGQAGFRLEFGGVVVYIDPYLSDRVERLEGPGLKRQRPIPVLPGNVRDADYLLITHIHMDHCDPDTVLPLLAASPQAKVVGPHEVIDYLVEQGMPRGRGVPLSEAPLVVNDELTLFPIPAAHPVIERDAGGHLRCLGFLLRFRGRSLYHSGDTSPNEHMIEVLSRHAPVDVALLPINEKNFYRDKQGIIGNMSIREAFGMAADMKARRVVPMHYDMFRPNMTFLDELAVVYRELKPDFELLVEPVELQL